MLSLNLWNEIEQMQDQLNRMLQPDVSTHSAAVNLSEDENSLIASAELPGIDPAQLDVVVEDRALTIRGSYPERQLKSGERWLSQERRSGQFVRKVYLPFRVESGKVEATYRHGVLTLTMPKAESAKPKRIEIKTA